jgi:hypothetical protein
LASAGLSSEFVGRINGGEAFDVIAVPPAALDGLIASGKVAADSKTNLARSGYGVAVRPEIEVLHALRVKLPERTHKQKEYVPAPAALGSYGGASGAGVLLSCTVTPMGRSYGCSPRANADYRSRWNYC